MPARRSALALATAAIAGVYALPLVTPGPGGAPAGPHGPRAAAPPPAVAAAAFQSAPPSTGRPLAGPRLPF